uniref:Uncharacterized protein n=1 Tax=Anguilla anguilla TaxID=7936 RepID=A0A0E9UW29_ANGAN
MQSKWVWLIFFFPASFRFIVPSRRIPKQTMIMRSSITVIR